MKVCLFAFTYTILNYSSINFSAHVKNTEKDVGHLLKRKIILFEQFKRKFLLNDESNATGVTISKLKSINPISYYQWLAHYSTENSISCFPHYTVSLIEERNS